MQDPILVTGATGFLGYYVSERWASQGHQVRGLTRSSDLPIPPGVDRCVAIDLADRDGIRAAMKGVRTVVHLAARVHVTKETARDPLSEFRRVHVDGTAVLVEEAQTAGVSGFVFASSIKAICESSDVPLTEVTTPVPVDPYGISKLEAEEVVAAASRDSLQSAIFRFPALYGPGMKANMLQLFRAVGRGLPLPLGSVNNRRSLLYVGNAFFAINRILESQPEAHAVYLISDGEDVSTPGFVRDIARAMGKNPRLWSVPEGALHTMGRAGDTLGRFLPFPIKSHVIQRLTESLFVDSTFVWRRLEAKPPVSLKDGLLAAARWFSDAERT
jgi:nucleoside-diphosphate-sugar epimerase